MQQYATDVHNAAAPAAGYLYQARFALSEAVRHAYQDSNIQVAIERLDDVSFHRAGAPLELLQTKHNLRRAASLTDSSPELWKTLRVWSEKAAEDPSLPLKVRLLLVTTSNAPPDSAASLLKRQAGGGDVGSNAKRAADLLTIVAQGSRSSSLSSSFSAFLSLTPSMRASLLSAVEIVDAQPRLTDLEAVIEDGIRMVAPRGKARLAREMLEGWWWPRVCHALSHQPADLISVLEIETKLDEIREALKRDALVTEFDSAEPGLQELESYEGFAFVRQLQVIGLGQVRISHAKRDYFRAFSQRSSWGRKSAVLDDEIDQFERVLIEEWESRFEAMHEKHQGTTDANKLVRAGQQLYEWVEADARFPFRSLVRRFLNVGSFNMLANDLRVGWHRDYLRLCRGED